MTRSGPTYVAGAGGVSLALGDVGDLHAATTVVLLHGGAQTRHAWGSVGDELAAAGFRAVAVDLRGHGDSGWATDGDYSPATLVADLKSIVDYIGGPVVLVGASLGGLVSILFSADHPELAVALVLVDVVPLNNPAGVERIRQFMAASPDGFETFQDAVAAVAAYQPYRTQPADPSGLRRNLRQAETGRLVWHWDHAFLLHNDRPWSEGKERLLVAAAAGLTLPTALLVGADSDVVDAAAVRSFQDLVPHAQVRVVPGARHMIAGDRNDIFGVELLAFLTRPPGPA